MKTQMKRVLLVMGSMVLMSGLLALPPAMAKPGGILVDDDQSCYDTNREENVFGNVEDITIWVNQRNSGGQSLLASAQLTDKGKVVATTTLGSPTDYCPGDSPNAGFAYYRFGNALSVDYDWSSSPTGSLTLKAFNGLGENVGSDSFRVIP
jgi:hypothetical protein